MVHVGVWGRWYMWWCGIGGTCGCVGRWYMWWRGIGGTCGVGGDVLRQDLGTGLYSLE